MAEPVTALLPLFRSEHQMRLLAEIFSTTVPPTGADLVRRTGIPQQTVAREVARLVRSGLLETERIGSAKVVRPTRHLPYGAALRQLLAYAGGIIPLIDRTLRGFDAIQEVFIFGSWAARYHGEPGPPPNDVDVAVVSDTLTRFDLAEARLHIQIESGINVDLFVLQPDSERLEELRRAAVPVFAQAPA